MNSDPKASIHDKCRQLILFLNICLNKFPRHEKYGLCQEIRQSVYGVLGGLVECQKKYHNKTSLTKLDVQHEQLRVFVNLAFEMGYFSCLNFRRNNSKEASESEALRVYTAVSVLVNELGAMIGGWIRSLRETPQAG